MVRRCSRASAAVRRRCHAVRHSWLLRSLLRCRVPGVSFASHSAFAVRDLAGYGDAGGSSDQPLVFAIDGTDRCLSTDGAVRSDRPGLLPVEDPPERQGFHAQDLKVVRDVAPPVVDLGKHQPACVLLGQHHPILTWHPHMLVRVHPLLEYGQLGFTSFGDRASQLSQDARSCRCLALVDFRHGCHEGLAGTRARGCLSQSDAGRDMTPAPLSAMSGAYVRGLINFSPLGIDVIW